MIAHAVKGYKGGHELGWRIFGLALAGIVVAVSTDAYMTKCQPGSFYAIVELCSPSDSG